MHVLADVLCKHLFPRESKMQLVNGIILLLIISLTVACSGEDASGTKENANDDRIWKTQTDALERARQVENILLESAEERRGQIEEQSQ